MLKTTDNLNAYRLAAGEPFLLSVQVRDKASKAVIDMSQRPLVLSFYRTGTREPVAQIDGVLASDASGAFYRFARDGTLSDSLFGQSLTIELIERFKNGRNGWTSGRLEVAPSTGGVETFGEMIGRSETRISVYLDAAGYPRVWEQELLPFSADVDAAPYFTTPASIVSDGTPQVGEPLTGIDGAATDTTSYTRRWLLGSSALTTSNTYTPQAIGNYQYEVTAEGPGGSTISASMITVAAATPVPAPTFGLSAPVVAPEGNSGTTLQTWTVTLNRDGSTDAFPFTWAVAGAGANPASSSDFGGAFPSASGTFAPGETAKTISVPVSGDTAIELDETFSLTVSVTGIGGVTSTGTIANDDVYVPVPSLSLSAPVTQNEGNSGTTAFAWTLTLNRDGSTASFAFNWSVAGSGSNPADAADFGGAFPSGSGAFAPGETSKTILVLAAGDAAVEPNEAFTLTVAANGLGTVTSTGSITNDDVAPTPTVTLSAAQSKAEGNSGATLYTYTVARSASSGAVVVPWSFAPGSTSADDFTGGTYPAGGNVSMADGATSGTFSVSVNGDVTIEQDEQFTVSIARPSGYAAGASMSATGTVANDDVAGTPTIAFANPTATVAEGNSGTKTVSNVINVTRNGVTGPLTVNLSYAGTATSGTDYVAGPVSATIADGVSATSFDLMINGDTGVETDETIIINAAVGASTASKTITISNDDVAAATWAPLTFEGGAPVIDLDYANSRYLVGSTTYNSLADAVTAGVLAKSANSPSGDEWTLPSAVGNGMSYRFAGTSPSTYPANGAEQYAFYMDAGAGFAESVFVGRSYVSASSAQAKTSATTGGGAGVAAFLATIGNGSAMSVAGKFATGAGASAATASGQPVSTTTVTRPSNLTKLIVGANRSANRNFADGVIGRITVWNAGFTNSGLSARARGNIDGMTISSLRTGFIQPNAIRVGDRTIFGGYTPSNTFVASVDSSGGATNGRLLQISQLSSAFSEVDDHNTPFTLKTPGGALLTAWNGHVATTLQRYRRATNPLDFSTFSATLVQDLASTGDQNSYNQAYVHASTGAIYAFRRQGLTKWTYTKSADDGVTFGAAATIFQDTDQCYMMANWIDQDTLFFLISKNSSLNTSDLRSFTWNVVTGVIATGTGQLATVPFSSTSTGVNLSDCSVFLASSATESWGQGVYGPSSQGFALIISSYDDNTKSSISYYYRYKGTGSIHDKANWNATSLGSGGTGGGKDSRFTGGTCISQIAGRTRPRLFRGIHGGGTWKIVQVDAVDDAATAFTQTRVLRTVPDTNYNVAFKPISPLDASPSLEVMWQEGYYYDYFGVGNLDLAQVWKQDS